MNTSKKRLLDYEDLRRMELLSNPVCCPQKKLIAYVVRHSESADGIIRPTVYVTDYTGSFNQPVRIADHDQTKDPAFSPDGSLLGFLSDATGCFQAYCCPVANIIPCGHEISASSDTREISGTDRVSEDEGILNDDGKAAVKLTDLRHGIESFSWNPTGKEIVFAAPLWADDPLITPQMTAEELADFAWQQKHLPKYISELMYKFDDCKGLVDGSQTVIGTVPVSAGQAAENDVKAEAYFSESKAVCHEWAMKGAESVRLLTHERWSFHHPVYAPDGHTIYVQGKPYGHAEGLDCELFAITGPDTACPQVTRISSKKNYQGSTLAFCPGSRSLFYSFTSTFSNDTLYNSALFELSPDGKDFHCLFPEKIPCDGINPLHTGITENGSHSPFYQASSDGKTFYFSSAWDGKCAIYALSMGDHEITRITDGDFSITEFSLAGDHELAVLLTTETSPLDLYLLDTGTGKLKPIVRHNSWLDQVQLSIPLCLTMPTNDPAMPVCGFVCPPVDLDRTKTYPSFHYIHGGPEAFYAVGFDFEIQMMAAKGLAVIYCNPRGSAGCGPEFVQAHFSNDGTAYQDLMNFTDYVLEQYSWLDPDRMGVGGGSHGGWMTNYIMGHTDRFRAAVDQRTFSNPATSYGTGDLGFYSWSRQGAHNFMEYMENRARKSAIRYVDNFSTPCLLLHGEKDLRCSLEQSEQIFSAMKARVPDVPVKMVVYPGENHSMSRTGKVHWQISHLKEMIEWVQKYTRRKEADT